MQISIVIPLCYTNIYGMAQPNELQTSSRALSTPPARNIRWIWESLLRRPYPSSFFDRHDRPCPVVADKGTSSRFSMSDSDENILYGRKFGSGFRGTRHDGTAADDVENTPIIPDDMYRRIILINLDVHHDRVKIERFHFCLPFMHIASACENQSSERSERIIGVLTRRTNGVSLNRPEILPRHTSRFVILCYNSTA